MTEIYRLATVEFRGRCFPVVEVRERLLDLGVAYDAFKAATGRRDFFRADDRHSMLTVLEDWDLFEPILDAMSAHYATKIGAGETIPFAYALSEVRLMAPILYPDKLLNAGSNYYDHALEMGAAAPDRDKHEPYFFYKGGRHTVIGDGAPIVLTPRSKYIDWEAELAVVIARTAKNVPVEKAMDYVAGYTCYNDISARDRMIRQKETFDYDWFANKGNDTFAPLGPFILPAKFVADPHAIQVRCWVSGELMQDYSTSNMVFKIPELIANVSSITTLSPGDVIATGTGAGVGMGKGVAVKHGEIHKVFEHMYAGGARLLKPGDTVAVEIDGIGRLENPVR